MMLGDKVLVTGINEPGTVASIHRDARNEDLILVELTNPDATPDGFFLARKFELRPA